VRYSTARVSKRGLIDPPLYARGTTLVSQSHMHLFSMHLFSMHLFSMHLFSMHLFRRIIYDHKSIDGYSCSQFADSFDCRPGARDSRCAAGAGPIQTPGLRAWTASGRFRRTIIGSTR